jgi:hypothetical protein
MAKTMMNSEECRLFYGTVVHPHAGKWGFVHF